MQPVIIGTAGHIDHGKTALVKALTGTNTDRLKEEQERGITIDLGYAFLTDQIALIDVPGHERFIKNMVAGAATVDFALLAVAADDGIMPQTREHFDILRLLGVEDGVVALTKCGLAEDDMIGLVEEEIAGMVRGSFLEGRPVVRVDSLSGSGIPALREALIAMAKGKRATPPGAFFRLPIDRVFSMKGFGTVVTGSALSGAVSVDDRLELMPQAVPLRVRGIESQGRMLATASAGMRVALNLPDLSVGDASRGDVVAAAGRMKPTFMLDAECRILENSPVALTQRERVRLHLGTKEVMARAVILDREKIDPGEDGLVQFRLEEPTAAQRLDRYVIRRYSPQVTIGGGRLLDANPEKHRKRHGQEVVTTLDRLKEVKDGTLILGIAEKAGAIPFDDLVTAAGVSEERVEGAVAALRAEGEILAFEAKGALYLSSRAFYRAFEAKLLEALDTFHRKNRLSPGVKRGQILPGISRALPEFAVRHFVDLSLASGAIKSVGRDRIALSRFSVALTAAEKGAVEKLERLLRDGGFKPPDLPDLVAALSLREEKLRELLQLLVEEDKAINLEGKLYFHAAAVEEGAAKLRAHFQKAAELTMSEFRILVDTTRKYALPLLNHYDSLGYTARRGDVRFAGAKLKEGK